MRGIRIAAGTIVTGAVVGAAMILGAGAAQATTSPSPHQLACSDTGCGDFAPGTTGSVALRPPMPWEASKAPAKPKAGFKLTCWDTGCGDLVPWEASKAPVKPAARLRLACADPGCAQVAPKLVGSVVLRRPMPWEASKPPAKPAARFKVACSDSGCGD